ncbi:MAG: nucleoside triphosphate pyrophosphohydrolase [Pyrodictiaceae archaeon]
MVCWKLVRDRLGRELGSGSGDNVVVRRASGPELERLLRAKIVEEAAELAASGSFEEAVDLFEALLSWLRIKGYGLEDLVRAAEEKRRSRGSFEEGYIVFWLDRDVC